MRGVLLDADILNLFAKVDAMSLLCEILKCDKLPITPGVFNEIMAPLTYGYEFPNRIIAVSEIILMRSEETQDFEMLRLEGKVSAADAEMIAICSHRGWGWVTMDRVATREARARNVQTIGLDALLLAGLTRGMATKDQLAGLMAQMEKADKTIYPFKRDLLGDDF